MRLLFISLTVPLPANNGLKMRTWAMLRALAAEGHETTLLMFADAGEDIEIPGLRQVCARVVSVPLRLSSLTSGTDYAGRLRNLLSTRPYAVNRFRSSMMRGAIVDILRQRSHDAVFCETVYGMINVPATGVPLILDNHNVEHFILERYRQFETNPLKRLYAQREAVRLRAEERAACARATLALCCSDADRQYFAQLCPEARLHVVPNVVEIDESAPSHDEPPPTVLYQGGMDWFPNRDAVKFFIESMVPRLRRAVPGIRFVVAGRGGSSHFEQQFADMPDVYFTGTVPDMKPWVAGATVCVVPLRIGSGTRLKILEAAAMGKAVVSTSVGAEGLDFAAGKEIMIAADADEFIGHTLRLLKDPCLRARIGAAARAKVERCYSFGVLREALAAALAECPA